MKKNTTEKIHLKEPFPPEGFQSAENQTYSTVEQNWYKVTEFQKGSTLWGLPVISGATKRAAQNSSAVDCGDLFDADGELQLPSGAVVKFETAPYDRIWVGRKYTEIVFEEKDRAEVLAYFNAAQNNDFGTNE